MAVGTNIRTYFNGTWHEGDVPIMRAADHGSWLGSTVFDGARYAYGLTPDLMPHCERVNRSAKALNLDPTHTAQQIYDISLEGLAAYGPESAVYIRPMYWATEGGASAVAASSENTGFAICLEEIPMPPIDKTVTLGRTKFCRPVMDSSVCDAKAGCLYPNNGRMLREVNARGFNNALVADALGNVAESATANVFMVKDGAVFTPVSNGTFLSGITRARHLSNLHAEGVEVHETVLSFDDFKSADEVFLSGNMAKVTPVTGFEDVSYQAGPVTKQVREMYWDWAKTV